MADSEEEEDTMDQTQGLGNDSGDEDEDVNETTMDIDPRAAGGFENQLAKKLVRYALSCEFSRTPIRRQGIREKGRAAPMSKIILRRETANTEQSLGSTRERSRGSSHSRKSSCGKLLEWR